MYEGLVTLCKPETRDREAGIGPDIDWREELKGADERER